MFAAGIITSPFTLFQKILKDLSLKENANQLEQLKEGTDFYFEAGLMVFTSAYHEKRGFCCKNRCRHCPYGMNDKPSASRKSE
jgi:hypothetical protein